MSNKTDATFHGPPDDDTVPPATDPWPADTLPQREPHEVLTHWDDYWLDRAEYVRNAPPWVHQRRREQLLPCFSQPSAPPLQRPRTVRPEPGWLWPGVAGVVAALAFLAVLAAIAAVGLL